MEKVENSMNDFTIYRDKFAETIALFCDENNIENLLTMSQNVWTACLMYLQRVLFPTTDIFKGGYGNNDNYYNPNKVQEVLKTYMFYCLLYDKECSIVGFSYLTGIHRDVIISWGNKDTVNTLVTYRDGTICKPSIAHYDIYKTLSDGREQALSAKLASNKGNPVGIIAILNHFYGWASPYTSDANKDHRQLVQRQTVQAIQDNQTPPPLPDGQNES